MKLTPLPGKAPKWQKVSIVAGLVSLVLAIVGFITFSVLRGKVKHPAKSRFVSVDAGLTSSKLHAFSWEASLSTASQVSEDFYGKTKDGVVAYANNYTHAADEILDMINTKITGGTAPVIPAYDKATTLLMLGATAGVRLFNERDKAATDKIFRVLRTRLPETGLVLNDPNKNIRILSGEEEALNSWIGANYLSKAFDTDGVFETWGYLECSGASARIAFETDKAEKRQVDITTLYGKSITIYRHDYLCYGQETFIGRILAIIWENSGKPRTRTEAMKNPCINKGAEVSYPASEFLSKPCYTGDAATLPDMKTQFKFSGTGDFAACTTMVKSLFTKPCQKSSCGIDDVYQPPNLPKNMNFVATSTFYFTADFFKVPSKKLSLAQYRLAVETACLKEYADLKKENPGVSDRYLRTYCMMGIYIDELLKKLHFDEDSWGRITFTRQIGDRTVGWSLGYLLQNSVQVPPGKTTYVLGRSSYVALMALSGVFLFFTCVFLTLWFVLRVRGS